ncbi:MAG: cation:dicarboxylase symporter family transporter [Sporomusaceae bacterium]|nr:cation:dicarboxylase symporter family transporter [Sporomusaceae bacterium]
MEEVKKPKLGLASQIFIGMILGVAIGYFFPNLGKDLKPLGDIFIRMIKMIVVPLVFGSLVMGIAGSGDFKTLGRLALKAFIWFTCATALALIIGMVIANVAQPGTGVERFAEDMNAVQSGPETKKIDMVDFVVKIIPTNAVDAAARGDMLQIVAFSVFFGVSAAAVGAKGKPVVELSKSIAEIMFKFTDYVMKAAPYGVCAMMAYTIGRYGLGILLPLGKLVFSLYFALIVFLALVFLIASMIFRVNFFSLFRAIKEPLIISFSTAASEAALPLAMERLEKFGIPKHIVTFVLPTGYTFNLDGSTLYSSLAVVFIAQVYNIPFPIETQILMLATLLLATKGIAAVPGASLIVIAGTASAFGLPAEGIALVLGVDRFMDMARTTCNVTGNCLAAAIVARWEGALPDSVLLEAKTKNYNE